MTHRLQRPSAPPVRSIELPAYRLEVHADDCPCCAQDAQPTATHDGATVAAWCALGIAYGLLLAFILDRLTGGPGLGVMLGW